MVKTTVFLLLLWVWPVHAQTIKQKNYSFPSHGSFRQGSVPADALDLFPLQGSPKGKVWVEHWLDGLVVMVKMEERILNWARFPLEMDTRAHFRLWLAVADQVPMPEIGWGDQFGFQSCGEYQPGMPGNEDCGTWSSRQASYRSQLKKLFVREWRLSPTISREVFASEAYRTVLGYANDRERDRFEKLEPVGKPFLQGYDDAFGIYVHWSDLPPASSLTFPRIYLALEFYDDTGRSSSTAPSLEPGNPATFNRLDFEQPPVSRISSCGSRLLASDPYGEMQPAWYFPTSSGEALDVFTLVNDAAGYRYAPEGLSPLPRWTRHFSKNLDGGDLVCGPTLTFLTGSKAIGSDYWIEESPLSYRKQDDGSYLLKWGPRLGSLSSFGSGQDGASPTVRVDVFRLGAGYGISKALNITHVLGNWPDVDMDIQFSADWKTVTVFSTSGLDRRVRDENWSSKQYCFSGTRYKECKESGPSDPPPLPRQVNIPRNY